MPETAVEMSRRLVELWNAGDLESVYALWDPDIVVRPDPDFPEGACFGPKEARRFWEDQRDSMGLTHLVVEEEHDLSVDRCLMRIYQPVQSRHGLEGGYSWSMIVTVREARALERRVRPAGRARSGPRRSRASVGAGVPDRASARAARAAAA